MKYAISTLGELSVEVAAKADRARYEVQQLVQEQAKHAYGTTEYKRTNAELKQAATYHDNAVRALITLHAAIEVLQGGTSTSEALHKMVG